MSLRRIILVPLVVGLATTTATAYAAKAPKPMCYEFKDVEGDGHPTAAPVIESPALDILSGDISSGKKTVKGILRLKTTDTTNDRAALVGMKWNLNFTLQGTKYSFTRSRSAGPTPTYTDRFYVAGQSSQPKDLKVTMNGNSITWTIPRSYVPGLKKPRSVFSELAAGSTLYTNNADAAGSTTKYPDMYPHCLKPA